jgi:hypothetical protein
LRLTNKRITIRAGKDNTGNGYRPAIEFDPGPSAAESDTRLITLGGGELTLINVDVHMNVRDDSLSDQWALLWLQGAERVDLEGVNVTIHNPAGESAAMFELKSGPGRDLENMNKLDALGGGQSAPEQDFRIKLENSFVRGNCDLFVVKHHEPGRFVLENSAVAIDGSVLYVVGDADMMPAASEDVELQLDHVTGIVGNGLVRMDSGQESRQLLPVQVAAENNIFATNTASPLVRMTGSTPADDLRTRLAWNGRNNYYENFSTFWSIASTIPAAMPEDLDFDAWKSRWGGDTEVDPKLNAIVWEDAWQTERRLSELSLARLRLDEDARVNRESWSATDAGNVGVDFSQLAE